MRIRKRNWTEKELEECPFYIDVPQNNIGKWNEIFEKNQPLQIELGCGKGMFIANLAVQNPQINYIAVDLIDTMLGLAKRNVEQIYKENNKSVNNVILTRCDIERILTMINEKDIVERIYINFCNPWPRGKHRKKRLTHTRQLEKYKIFLPVKGEIYFKTDDDMLFYESLNYFEESGFEIVAKTEDLHNNQIFKENIITEHELMFTEQGIKIKACITKRIT